MTNTLLYLSSASISSIDAFQASEVWKISVCFSDD